MNKLVSAQLSTLTALCRQHRVRQLDLFGSAAGDRFDPNTSDLDFLVVFLPMPPAEHAAHFFGLLEDLERLFGRLVDLVELEPVHNPFFRQAIDQTRVPLYAAA